MAITTDFKNIEDELEKRLFTQIKAGKIEGEQWYKNPLAWLLICFNNPLNFKNSNGELVVFHNNKKSVSKYIKGHSQIHYGVGVGETELELITFELEQSGFVNIEAVDINKTFVELFSENLKDKLLEFGENSINAKLTQDLFQNYVVEFNEKVFNDSVKAWGAFFMALPKRLSRHLEKEDWKSNFQKNFYGPSLPAKKVYEKMDKIVFFGDFEINSRGTIKIKRHKIDL